MRKSGYIKKCIFLVTIAICQSMQDCVTHFLNNTSQRLYQSCYNKLGRFRRNLQVPWTTDDGHQIDNISSHGPSELRLQNNRHARTRTPPPTPTPPTHTHIYTCVTSGAGIA